MLKAEWKSTSSRLYKMETLIEYWKDILIMLICLLLPNAFYYYIDIISVFSSLVLLMPQISKYSLDFGGGYL